MNYFALIPLFALIINCFTCAYVWAKNAKSSLNRAYVLYAALLGLWLFLDFLTWSPIRESWLLPLGKLNSLCWFFIVFLFLNFTYTFIERKRDILYRLFFLFSVIAVIISILTPFIIKGYQPVYWGTFYPTGFLFVPAVFLTIICPSALSLWLLLKEPRDNKAQKSQLKWVLTGSLIPLGGGLVTNVFLPYIFEQGSIIQLASTLVTIQSVFVFVAVIRHGFMSVGIEDAASELFTNLRDPVLIMDNKNHIKHANPSALKMLGQPGQAPWIKDPMFLTRRIKNYNLQRNYHNLETTITISSGRRRAISITQEFIRQGLEKIGKILIIRDINDQKMVETALLNAKKAAEDANRAKTEFLANMSHEFQTPLNAILGFTDMLLSTDLNLTQKDYTKTIEEGADELLALINNFLDFAKIEANELHFQETEFDPRLAARDVCDMIKPMVRSKPIILNCRIESRVPSRVRGDPERFRQVISNLMKNAPKFTESGEIELAMSVNGEEEHRIQLHTTIRDTGIGIPTDKLASIFLPLQQCDGSTTRSHGGTGLGLALCKGISRLMGGDVWAESNAGCHTDKASEKENPSFKGCGPGSTFHFTAWFKKSGNDGYPSGKAQTHSKDTQKKGRVLLVEDNPVNSKLAKIILKKAGYDVTLAQNGKEAVDGYASNSKHIDLILMDIQMPVMDGMEATQKIRAQERLFAADGSSMNRHHPNETGQTIRIPIIALTAHAMKGDREFCLETGMDDYITKPVTKDVLLKTLEKWYHPKLSPLNGAP